MPVLACDIGGTQVKIGIVDDGELLADSVLTPGRGASLAATLPFIRDGMIRLCEETGIKPSSCAGIGLGFPALIDHAGSRVMNHYGKYTDAPGIDLVAWADQAFGLPIALENDARMALVGEWQCGAGRNCRDLAILTLGTGIGSAIVSDGNLLRGPNGQAGILCGHTVINMHGNPCVCGKRGCVEAETGSTYLPGVAKRHPKYVSSTLASVSALDFHVLYEHAVQGDQLAVELRDRAIEYWGALCVNMIHMYDIQRIILGGGILGSADQIIPALIHYVAEYDNTPFGDVLILSAEHPNQMALYGAEWLVHEKYGACTRGMR